jgi:RNA polymerase sigma-70 factor (ECF subfamily)
MERKLTAGAAAEDPEERASARERLRQVERALDLLPPAYRSAFVLRELERLSGAEAARALGTTEEAIRLRLHRARKVLRRALGDERAAQDAYAFAAPRCDRVVAAVMARLRAR